MTLILILLKASLSSLSVLRLNIFFLGIFSFWNFQIEVFEGLTHSFGQKGQNARSFVIIINRPQVIYDDLN